ncbi:hypothetical protein AAFF_G00244730 [Aldrovandia affinis]|uniref:Uncharacterized protein n=1 Tax=Aldrovandia affinis TaxID=143900 RepID=A0AAD7RGB7_9TELE|nr:hypothetical protein AAFF_G00244730 [Aldrovandia affinis]
MGQKSPGRPKRPRDFPPRVQLRTSLSPLPWACGTSPTARPSNIAVLSPDSTLTERTSAFLMRAVFQMEAWDEKPRRGRGEQEKRPFDGKPGRRQAWPTEVRFTAERHPGPFRKSPLIVLSRGTRCPR